MMRIIPNLWFDGTAEVATRFYVSLFPDSRIDTILTAPADNPSTQKGAVLVVRFTLAGQQFAAINGGPAFRFTEAVSFEIPCRDQAEIDRYWDALTADGGAPSMCGWCKDRYGLSWQVVPVRLGEMMAAGDAAAAERVMNAMMTMHKLDLAELEAAFAGG